MHSRASNEASRYLIALARQIVQVYTNQPSLRAVILTGSAVDGISDGYSDLDVIAYYDTLPSEEELQAAFKHNQGTQHQLLAPRSETACMEMYYVQGVECQIGHVTISQWEQDMASVLEQCDVTSPLQKAFWGMLNATALYGEPFVHAWQQVLAAYPDKLAEAMITHYLDFVPVWVLYERVYERDATIWWYQMLVELAFHLLGVLAGLNRCYYTTTQFKHMRLFISQLQIAPIGLADRLEQLFRTDPASQKQLAKELAAEVVALVEQRMPQIDTTVAQRRLNKQLHPWQIPPHRED